MSSSDTIVALVCSRSFKHQVVHYNDGRVREVLWTPAEILANSQRVPCVHVEWDGINHYAAWVASTGRRLRTLRRAPPSPPRPRSRPRDGCTESTVQIT